MRKKRAAAEEIIPEDGDITLFIDTAADKLGQVGGEGKRYRPSHLNEPSAHFMTFHPVSKKKKIFFFSKSARAELVKVVGYEPPTKSDDVSPISVKTAALIGNQLMIIRKFRA